MAFENPFLIPSVARKEALRYLWSDEPTGDSFQGRGGANIFGRTSDVNIVDDVFGLSTSENYAINIIGNIANNNGFYNPNDTTDYSSWSEENPVESLKFLEDNKGLIKATLNILGVPFASSIIAGIEQNEANNVLGRVEAFVGQYGGVTTEKGSVIGEALKAALPYGVGSFFKSDSIEAAKSLINAFGTTGAMDGYFRAALDPTIGQIVSGMIADPTTITPAQYGTIGQAVGDRINNNVVNGMNLNQAQNEAVNFFNPPTAISIPVEPPGSVEVTNLPPLSVQPDPIGAGMWSYGDAKPPPPQPIFEPIEPAFEPPPPQPIFEPEEPAFEPQPIFEPEEPAFEPLPPQPIFEPIEPVFEPQPTPEVISTPVEPFGSVEVTNLPPISEQPDPIGSGMWSYADAEPPQPIFEPVEPVFEPQPIFEPIEPAFEPSESLIKSIFEPIEPAFEPLPPQPIFEPIEPAFEPLPPQPIFEPIEPAFEPLPPQPIFEPVEPAFEPLPPQPIQPDPIGSGMWSYADAEPLPTTTFTPQEPLVEPDFTNDNLWEIVEPFPTTTFELQEPFFEFDSLTNKWGEPISFSSWQVGGYYDPFSDFGFGFDVEAK